MRDFTLRAFSLFMIFVPLAAVSSDAAGSKKGALPTVVLLPVNLHGDKDKEKEKEALASYQGAIAESLQSRYRVIAGSKVEEVLKKVTLKESQKEAECDMMRCYGAIAMEFNAEFVAVVDVTGMEGDYSVSLKILDVVAGELALSRTDTCRACKVIDVVEKLKLLAGGEKTPSAPPPAVEAPAAQASKEAGGNEMELTYWNSVKDSTNPDDFEAYLQDYPKGKFAGLAKNRLASLKKAAAEKAAAMKMDKTEVTQEAYQKVMGSNPSHFTGCPTCPVEQVSWDDAELYCKVVGKRLPTEQEWEYAATSGGKGETWAGTSNGGELGDYAWYDENSTHPVGQKKPNGLGLYDMSGNVWEWTDSWYDDNKKERVLRGGSWSDNAGDLRTALRGRITPGTRYFYIGFRCSQY